MSRILQTELIGRRLTKRWYIYEPYPPYPIVNQLAHELNDKQKMRLFCKYDEVWMEPKIKSNWIWKKRDPFPQTLFQFGIALLTHWASRYYLITAGSPTEPTHTHTEIHQKQTYLKAVSFIKISLFEPSIQLYLAVGVCGVMQCTMQCLILATLNHRGSVVTVID